MIEENVVSSAGTVYHLSLAEIKRAIRESGYIPRQRNVFYEYHRRRTGARSGRARSPADPSEELSIKGGPTCLPGLHS